LVNLTELLVQMSSEYESLVDKKEVALSWDYPTEPLPMVTDSAKLKYILQNLINNAIKFTDEGTVTICAVVRPTRCGMRDPRCTMQATR
jgi:signal transduction histidine kinase